MKSISSYKLIVAALGSALIAAPLNASAGDCGNGKTWNKQASQPYTSAGMNAYPAHFVPMVHRTTSSGHYGHPGV